MKLVVLWLLQPITPCADADPLTAAFITVEPLFPQASYHQRVSLGEENLKLFSSRCQKQKYIPQALRYPPQQSDLGATGSGPTSQHPTQPYFSGEEPN